jgi:ribosomal-protein-alanine N-acetyltransferase
VINVNQTIFNSFPTFETKNLVLRKIEPKDARDLFSFLSDEAVCRYLTNNIFKNIVQAQRSINGMQQFFDSKQKIRWGIAQKEDNRIIGYCGYFYFDETNLSGEINYCLAKENWGQGIMSEAIDAVIRFGFEKIGLNRVEAKTNPKNPASFRVLEKVGFKRDGLLREGLLKNGVFHDLYLYSILKKEYLAQ